MLKHVKWVLIRQNSDFFAKGFQVCSECVEQFFDGPEGSTYYKYGDWYCEDIIAKWDMDALDLNWMPLKQKYSPTFKDKLLKFLRNKDYPSEIKVYPDDGTLVIAECCHGEHYEVAEIDGKRFISELYMPVEIERWAYIPKECL